MCHVMDPAALRPDSAVKTPFFSPCPRRNPIVVTGSSHEPALAGSHYHPYLRGSIAAPAQPSSYFPSCPFYIYIGVYGMVSRPCEFSLDPFVDRPLHSEKGTACIAEISTYDLIQIALAGIFFLSIYKRDRLILSIYVEEIRTRCLWDKPVITWARTAPKPFQAVIPNTAIIRIHYTYKCLWL